MDPEGVEQFLAQKMAEIAEHFPHAILLVSWEEGRSTHMASKTAGNYYARVGMVKRFMDQTLGDAICDVEEARFPEAGEDGGF